MSAAKSWSTYEGACATLLPSPETVAAFQDDVLALGLARMEAHYFTHDIFLPENFLLNNVHKLHKIPATIVQGRYDIICPIITADELVKSWLQAEYIIVPDANHSAMEPGIKSELIKACDRFKKVLGK
jgi:proline iminopeptidase